MPRQRDGWARSAPSRSEAPDSASIGRGGFVATVTICLCLAAGLLVLLSLREPSAPSYHLGQAQQQVRRLDAVSFRRACGEHFLLRSLAKSVRGGHRRTR